MICKPMEAEDKIKFEEMGMRKIGKFTIAEKKEQQERRRRLRTLLRKICSKTKTFCLGLLYFIFYCNMGISVTLTLKS
jgi:hypothetical protein